MQKGKEERERTFWYISLFPLSFDHDHQKRHFVQPGMSGTVKE
jgi:hypothetical protein